MESNEARELARTVERAEAAPYITYPDMPWWFPVATGGWFAAMFAMLAHYESTLWHSLALVALLIVEFLYFRWYARKHGAFPLPGMGNPPPEISRVFREYFAMWVVVLVLVGLSWWQLGAWPAVAVTFVTVTLLFALHDWRYGAAAAAVRERLG